MLHNAMGTAERKAGQIQLSLPIDGGGGQARKHARPTEERGQYVNNHAKQTDGRTFSGNNKPIR